MRTGVSWPCRPTHSLILLVAKLLNPVLTPGDPVAILDFTDNSVRLHCYRTPTKPTPNLSSTEFDITTSNTIRKQNSFLAKSHIVLIRGVTMEAMFYVSNEISQIPGITHTIIKEFQYKISRASKCPLVHLGYDATACYDRIILPMASLIS